jgi:polysaccharide deacetylase family protein (PEP-CTERM system associated)
MNILTFDIEEWFHILDNDSTLSEKEWISFESRIHSNMERIFNLLELTNSSATFFCLGWVAEKYPELIREIDARGYEIGTHGRMHQLVYNQSKGEFENDLDYSLKTLEDLIGKKIKYYRAPGFSIRESNKWSFEIMAKMGIEVDCSVFPAPRAHGGFSSYPKPVPSILKYRDIELIEFPINYVKLLGKIVIFSGGGYFRLCPYQLIKKWTKQSDYVMSYLHPRDFDPGQPLINGLSIKQKFKSYVGLMGAKTKLKEWLTDFEFMDIRTAINIINWETVPVIEL